MPPVIVVGAGIGGLAAAVSLAARGLPVQVIERDSAIGGKLRPVQVGGQWLDAGPTVMTLRDVFDGLFAQAGERLDDHLRLTPLQVLARHAWPDGSRFDLMADRGATLDALGRFGGARAARDYAAFCTRAERIFRTLDQPYLRSPRPNPVSLTWRCARRGLGEWAALMRISPFQTLWKELARQFADPRLRQLFGRYATYGGSSPLAAPATLMLIAHVEQAGVWAVEGGMYGLAQALAKLARRLGVQIRCGQGVQRLLLHQGRVAGVQLDAGAGRPADTLPAQAVVFNGDAQALASGLLGDALRPAVPALAPARRSLSALTWNLHTPVQGFPLLRHTVFFSSDYPREFDELFRQRRLPTEPTVYLCAQDRGDSAPDPATAPGPERLLCLVNAPATGDAGVPDDEEIAACEQRTFAHLRRMGLQLDPQSPGRLRHGPASWAQRFPATGGALYGRATHGWQASFSRPPSATPVPGLVLAGGSTHPGAGVPMAALSGMLAADALLAQQPGRTSISTWRPAVMPGGTSMP